MKTVNVLLEGDKDVYFLREFILQRFPCFLREENSIPHRLAKEPAEMIDEQHRVKVILYKMGGFRKVVSHADLLLPKADVRENFSAAVVFDSDYPASGDSGGQNDRRNWIKKAVKDSRRHVDLTDDLLFLFPDNKDDGDLEVLMERMVSDTDPHRSFLDVCWRNFDDCVKKHGFNPLSQKSKLNEYSAAFNADTWSDGGVNAAFSDESLWNWNAAALNPLYNFLQRIIVV